MLLKHGLAVANFPRFVGDLVGVFFPNLADRSKIAGPQK